MTKSEMIELEYCGPPGQDSPVFGALEPGRRYQVDRAFGEYLAARHPDYWRRPAPRRSRPAQE